MTSVISVISGYTNDIEELNIDIVSSAKSGRSSTLYSKAA